MHKSAYAKANVIPSLRKATTLMICRPKTTPLSNASQQCDYELLFVKRSMKSRFMPGAHVFPGGAVDPLDDPSYWRDIVGAQTIDRFDKDAFTMRMSGVRECFEEASILLSKNRVEIDQKRLYEMQEATNRREGEPGKLTFLEVCKELNVVPNLEKLFHWSHWITPKQEKIRFDTHFYLVPLSADTSEVRVDNFETTLHDWLAPDQALSLHANGDISLAPPTWYTLYEMNAWKQQRALVDMAASRFIEPIEPELCADGVREGSMYACTLPGDEFYSTKGEKGQRHRIEVVKGDLTDMRTWQYELIRNFARPRL